MNKKYEITLSGNSFHNGGEAFSVLMNLLSTSFTKGTNHSAGLLHPNGMYVYFGATNFDKYFGTNHCAACPLRDSCKPIRLNIHIPITDDGKVYDWRNAEKPSKGIITDADGKFLGAYCKKKNTLLATDWSHWSTNAAALGLAFYPHLHKMNQKKELMEVTIGTDPEFEQLSSEDSYRVVWPSGIEGAQDPEDEIGLDGSGAQIELRPKASTKPEEVIEHLRTLIDRCGKPMSVKGDVHPLGGHIHIGFPQKIRATCRNQEHQFCLLYDAFLGIPMIDLSGAARNSYKHLTASELKPWGFEYRSLPAAWMVNPKIANITFILIKRITEDLINDQTLEVEVDENGVATEKEYLKRLTPRQYKYFEFFIEHYTNLAATPSINAAWTNIVPGVFPIFHGIWDAEIKTRVEERIKNISTKGVYRIVLYGLRDSRGMTTSGWNTEGFENISDGTMTSSYGIPYLFRVEDFPEDAMNDLITKIVADLQVLELGEEEEPVCA